MEFDDCFTDLPTHYCHACAKALDDKTWPYALCKECGEDGKTKCPHDQTWGECGQCDADGDRAYDASKGN